jgi:hypothetical protein
VTPTWVVEAPDEDEVEHSQLGFWLSPEAVQAEQPTLERRE